MFNQKKSKLMQTKGQLMKSLHTAFSFAPPSILSLTICEGCERYNYCRNTRCKLVNDVIEGNPYTPIAAQCQIENIVVELDEYVDKHI